MIPNRSFKFRLTLWYAFMLTVFLSAFAFLMYLELSRALYHDVEHSMLFESQRIEEAVVSRLREVKDVTLKPPPRIERGTLAFPREYQAVLTEAVRDWERRQRRVTRSLLLVRVVGLDNSVMLSNLGGWEREVIFPDFERDSAFTEKGQSFQTIHFQQRPIRLYYHLVRIGGRPFFVIQVAKPLHEIEATLSRLALIIAVIIPIGVALAGWAGWFLAKRFLSPVDQMIQQARKITAAYLKGRLPRTMTRDELDRLAETLNEMIDRLEASTRAVQEFSSNVSHEFKTPLAIIRGEIDLSLRRDRSQEDLYKAIRVIDEEVNGLVRLVDDLNLLVKSDSKQLNIQKKQLSLTHLLENVVGLYKERAQKAGVTIHLTAADEVVLPGDDIYLKRMFMNLLDNAVKFTDSGGRISVECSLKDRMAEVRISDSGIGIDPETLEHIGTRFYRADQARSREGAGLGLSIVKAICDAHLGQIRIESHDGQGTSVFISLPLGR